MATTDRKVPTRRVSFEASLQDVPKHFAADGDLLSSHLAASLSAVFPDGEDFFVRSVRRFRGQITDPELKAAVTGFIGQEAMHGREHRAFNDRLAQLGYPTKHFERMTKRFLKTRERIATDKANLAATAALEHFTATFAEFLLRDDHLREQFGHDQVRNLYLWHALEESEHKAVAFDVYKAVGGSELTRVWTMKGLMVGFYVGMAIQLIISVLGDRDTYRRGRLRTSWKTFKDSPLFGKAVFERLKDYNRPDFHPNDHDTTDLVEEWRTTLFGDEGELNEFLAA